MLLKPLFSRTTAGILFGPTAALMWAAFRIAIRLGAVEGLHTFDRMALRFGIAAVVLAPVLVWSASRRAQKRPRLTLGHALALARAAGPVFVALNIGGFQFAALAHGAVIQPATIAFIGMGLAALWLGEAMARHQIVGAALILMGIVAIAGAGIEAADAGVLTGDAMFVGAGLFWVAYTLFLKRRQMAAAMVSGLSVT